MNRLTIIFILVTALALGSYYFFAAEDATAPGEQGNEQVQMKTYSSDKFGIEFTYPATYHLEEKNVGTGERERYAIVMMEDTEENRLMREGKSPPRDGPVTITFDIHQNNLDHMSLHQWLTGTNALNFKQSNGTYASTTVASKEAIMFTWDGLYRGDTTAFLHKDRMIAVSVTYLAPEDQIRKDAEEIVRSIVLK